jgi:hypothetical protein
MHIYRSNPIPDHQNFFGVDENLGPVAVSLKREKLEDAPILHNLPPLSAPKLQYRFIARTSELQVLRGSVTEEAVQQATKTKNVSPKDVIEFVVPEIPIGCLKVAKQERKVMEELMRLDEQELNNRYKIGVLYCSANQSTEEDMYNNESGSSSFNEFLDFIGQRVELKGFSSYRAGMDTKTGTTGQHSVYTKFRNCEIMFHVSTLLPYQPHNRQQLQRKRHIGNDIVTIVFQDPGAEPFSAKVIRSQFQHVFIVVRAHRTNTPFTEYSLAVTRLQDVPYFGPPLPEKGRFKKTKEFREFLLTKLINAENAGHRCDKFMQMTIRTRQAYLQELATQCVTQQTVDTSSSSGFGLLRGLSRRKEKTNIASQYLAFCSGAVAWSGHLLLEASNNHNPQPLCIGSLHCSHSMEVVLALSIDSLVLMEVRLRQIILHIPTTCISGWSSSGSRINIYYDGVQCISLSICEMDEVDDPVAMVVARLQSVSPHVCKGVELQLPLSDIASMSIDNGLVLNPARQEILKQGDYIVQVGSVLTCADQNIFEKIQKSAHNCDELAHVFAIKHNVDEVAHVVYSVQRKRLNWKDIWSLRPDSGTAEIGTVREVTDTVAEPVRRPSTERMARHSREREISDQGQPSAIPTHFRNRRMQRNTKRTFSYIQAVDRDQSAHLSQVAGAGDSDGDSCHTNEDSTDGVLEEATFTDSDEGVPTKEVEYSCRSSLPVKKHDSPLATVGQTGEVKQIPSTSRIPEPATNKVSPWRKGRVQELRAVFAQNNGRHPPPLPSSTYLNATGTPDTPTPPATPGEDEAKSQGHTSKGESETYEVAGVRGRRVPADVSSSRFGFNPKERHSLSFSKSPSPKTVSNHQKVGSTDRRHTIGCSIDSDALTSNPSKVSSGASTSDTNESVRIRTAMWESKVSESGTKGGALKSGPTVASLKPVSTGSLRTKCPTDSHMREAKPEFSNRDEVKKETSAKGPSASKLAVPEKSKFKKEGGGFIPHSFAPSSSIQSTKLQQQSVRQDVCAMKSDGMPDMKKFDNQSGANTANTNSNNNKIQSSIHSAGTRNKMQHTASQLSVHPPSQARSGSLTNNNKKVSDSKLQLPRTTTLSQPASSPQIHQRSQSLIGQGHPHPTNWKRRRSSGETAHAEQCSASKSLLGPEQLNLSRIPSHSHKVLKQPGSSCPHATSTTKQSIPPDNLRVANGKVGQPLVKRQVSSSEERLAHPVFSKHSSGIPRTASSKQSIAHTVSIGGRKQKLLMQGRTAPSKKSGISPAVSSLDRSNCSVLQPTPLCAEERLKEGFEEDPKEFTKVSSSDVSLDDRRGSASVLSSTEVIQVPIPTLPPDDQDVDDLSSCSTSSNDEMVVGAVGDDSKPENLQEKVKSLQRELDKV